MIQQYTVDQHTLHTILKVMAWVWSSNLKHTDPAIVLEDECEFWSIRQGR